MKYAVGWYISGEDVVKYAADGRRFPSLGDCFDAVLAENKKGFKTLRHVMVDTESGIAPERVWMRVEAVDGGAAV
jgi:hypothetical protein